MIARLDSAPRNFLLYQEFLKHHQSIDDVVLQDVQKIKYDDYLRNFYYKRGIFA